MFAQHVDTLPFAEILSIFLLTILMTKYSANAAEEDMMIENNVMQSEHIISALEEEIVFGVLPPQARLIEESVARRFDAKRHVVREVFASLEDLGLVKRIPNKGAVVAELSPAEVRDIYDVREMLETGAALRTPLPAPCEITDLMSEIQQRHSRAVETENFRAVFRLNIEFHRAQYSASTNAYLVQTLHDYVRKAHLIRAVKYGDRAHLAEVVEQHWALIDALKGRNHEHLIRLIKDHLPASPEEYIRNYEIRYGRKWETSQSRPAASLVV